MKYRYHLLQGDIALRVRELVRQTCENFEIQILRGVVSKDHVHILVSAPPNMSPSEIMRRVKGRVSRLARALATAKAELSGIVFFIRKDRRDIYYGHRICVTGGSSNLILDCVVLEGNPPDSELTGMMLDRQEAIYGRYPLKAAFYGGFTSHANLKEAKAAGIKDICFSKGRGLEEEDMCRSKRVYKGLRKFRAGIEAGISWLKRSLGLDKCTWKGFESFKSYVWASIVSANLLTLARKQLA